MAVLILGFAADFRVCFGASGSLYAYILLRQRERVDFGLGYLGVMNNNFRWGQNNGESNPYGSI